MDNKITSGVETITPDDARLILAENRRNRTVSATRVRRLAGDIKSGDWQVNGEAIKIAADGMLLDGQHRLNAVIEAGRPIDTMVIRGLEASTQDTMDTGSARNLADVLKLAGEEQYSTLSAGLRALYCYSVTSFPMPPKGARHSPTTKQALALLEYHPGLRSSARFAANLPTMRYLNPSIVCVCHYLFCQIEGVEASDVESFFERVAKGEALSVGDPIYALRERMVKEFMEQGRVEPAMQAAFTVRTWNGVRKDEKMARLLYRHGDDCPRIVGLELWKV